MGSIQVFIISVIVALLVGIGCGATVEHWRLSGKISKAETAEEVAREANNQCQTDVKAVRDSVVKIAEVSNQRVKAAEKAMEEAQSEVDKRKQVIKQIVEAPIRKGESLCDAVSREQEEYVRYRKSQDH